jgi:hypothetical protein
VNFDDAAHIAKYCVIVEESEDKFPLPLFTEEEAESMEEMEPDEEAKQEEEVVVAMDKSDIHVPRKRNTKRIKIRRMDASSLQTEDKNVREAMLLTSK